MMGPLRYGRTIAGALCAGGTLLGVTAAWCQTLYVDDTMQVGVHQDKGLTSTVIELIPSGTAVEMLSREGALVQVQIPDGREGWVDASLLTDSEPGRARALALENELDATRAQLAGLQAQLAELENAGGGEPRPPAGDGAAADTIPSDTLREMQALAEENQRLKQQIAEIEAVQRMAVAKAEAAEAEMARIKDSAPSRPATGSGRFNIGQWQRWQQILLASVLLLAFAAGGWLVDWGTRRRHGGFRV